MTNTRRPWPPGKSERLFTMRDTSKPVPTPFGFMPHRTVIRTAEALIASGYYMSALPILQTACELLTEFVIVATLSESGFNHIREPLDELIPNYNLANERVRKLYVALTKDRIQNQTFWSDYLQMVRLRHQVIHRGKDVSEEQAKWAQSVTLRTIQHLEKMFNEAKAVRAGKKPEI
jgi:hypothetical protein